MPRKPIPPKRTALERWRWRLGLTNSADVIIEKSPLAVRGSVVEIRISHEAARATRMLHEPKYQE